MNQEVDDHFHRVVLYTQDHKPLLDGTLKTWVEQGLRHLPHRFPGLKITESRIEPDRVHMTLDFQRIDEDLVRVLQTFKSEVKNIAKKKGFEGDSLWQWQFDEE